MNFLLIYFSEGFKQSNLATQEKFLLTSMRTEDLSSNVLTNLNTSYFYYYEKTGYFFFGILKRFGILFLTFIGRNFSKFVVILNFQN